MFGDRNHEGLFVRRSREIRILIPDAERTHPIMVVPFLKHKNTQANIHTHKVRMFYFLGEAMFVCLCICVSPCVVCFCVFV